MPGEDALPPLHVAAPNEPTTDVQVRRVRRGAEADFVRGLEWLFEPPGGRPAQWDRQRAVERTVQLLANDHAALFEARSAHEELVGVASVYVDILSVRFGRRASIEDLAVHPHWRSRGVGAGLLAAAKSWAREHGADYVFLESGSARIDAHRFYLREGAAQVAASFRWNLNPHADA